jgi:hypothetical protein
MLLRLNGLGGWESYREQPLQPGQEGGPVHHLIPVHSGKELGPCLHRKVIRTGGLTTEEYLEFFNR